MLRWPQTTTPVPVANGYAMYPNQFYVSNMAGTPKPVAFSGVSVIVLILFEELTPVKIGPLCTCFQLFLGSYKVLAMFCL